MNDNRVTDQHMVHAGCAQFAECDFLLVGRYGGPSQGPSGRLMLLRAVPHPKATARAFAS